MGTAWRLAVPLLIVGLQLRMETGPGATPGAGVVNGAGSGSLSAGSDRLTGGSDWLPESSDWLRSDHRLGHGRFRPEGVRSAGAGFTLGVFAGSFDGSEIRSRARFGTGSYSIRMQTPRTPGSISTFFLYEGVEGDNDEIDIEILNDGSRKALLTAWRHGQVVRQEEVLLRFDPADGMHEYRIDWSVDRLELQADGKSLVTWDGNFAFKPMHIMSSVWFPAWLTHPAPPIANQLRIDRITASPVSSHPRGGQATVTFRE